VMIVQKVFGFAIQQATRESETAEDRWYIVLGQFTEMVMKKSEMYGMPLAEGLEALKEQEKLTRIAPR
jgi:hypothetical protein